MARTVTSGRACDTRSRESTRTRLDALFRRMRREPDCAAREELIKRFMPLARKLARRYARSSEPYEDLVQVASLALVKAVDRFDPGRGTASRRLRYPRSSVTCAVTSATAPGRCTCRAAPRSERSRSSTRASG